MSWCDLSIENIISSRTRSEKTAVKATHAYRIGRYVVVQYSTGVVRLLSEKHIARLKFRNVKSEYDIIQEILDGRIKLEDIYVSITQIF